MATKNIQMQVRNASNGYDILYPQVNLNNVLGLTENFYSKEDINIRFDNMGY